MTRHLARPWCSASAADLAALRDVLLRVSRLADDLPEISDLDLNPVIARADGVVAVDARIKLTPQAAPPPPNRALSPSRSSTAHANPATAIGTLIRNTDPHQNRASSTPPTIGPSAIPRPLVPAHRPIARCRSLALSRCGHKARLTASASDLRPSRRDYGPLPAERGRREP
jgi:ATP-grasp domain